MVTPVAGTVKHLVGMVPPVAGVVPPVVGMVPPVAGMIVCASMEQNSSMLPTILNIDSLTHYQAQ